MSKQNRQFAIRQIILRSSVGNQGVGNQDELRMLLEAEGYETTQATLSRDLKDMGVARHHTPDGPRYVLPDENTTGDKRLAGLLAYEIDSIEHNEVMIVIRTRPGRAAGVADIIDGFGITDILGTVAGDNTIFITPRSIRNIGIVVARIQKIVNPTPS